MDSSIITRSEAAYRLKVVAALLNYAASATRDGKWSEAVVDANEALQKLETILKHLEEASEAFPYSVPENEEAPSKKVGAMGYRGSAGNREAKSNGASSQASGSVRPPAPIVIPKPVTAPPAETEPVRKPIVTPAPATMRIDRHHPNVGEMVQWESRGMLLMPRPYKLERISEDGQWAFVEGSSAGIPYEELIQASDA